MTKKSLIRSSVDVDQFIQTFDSSLIKNSPKMVVFRCLILCSKFSKNRLLAALRPAPDSLRELTALPKPLGPSWIMERRKGIEG